MSRAILQFPAGFLATATAAQVATSMKPFLAPSDDPIVAQPYLPEAPPPIYTLEDKLAAAYSKTAYQLDAGTADTGKVLNIKADRFLRGMAQGMPTIGCVPVVRDGKPKEMTMMCKILISKDPLSVYIKPEDALVVSSFKVESKKDKDVVRLEVLDTSQQNASLVLNGNPTYYHADVDFEFPKGSLAGNDVAKISDEIAAVFNVAGGSTSAIKETTVRPPSSVSTTGPITPPAAPQSLEEQLRSIYKVGQVADTSVVARGTIFSVTPDKVLLGTPYAKPTVCPASVVDGAPKPPAASCTAPLKTAMAKHEATYFAAGQRVDLVTLSVDIPKETIAFGLIDDTAPAGAAPRFRSAINFIFPQGYLEASDAGQVGDLVNSVLQIADSGSPASSIAAAQPVPLAATPLQQGRKTTVAPMAADPGTVQLGMSPQQVEGILGPPKHPLTAGPKTIYMYDNLKIIFMNGKVTDVQ